MRTRLAILGATGSIGTSALDVARALPDVTVTAVTAHTDRAGLDQIASEFGAAAVLTGEADDPDAALCQVVERDDVDAVLLAVVGAAGARAAVACIEAGKKLLLANKEALVVAGPVLMPLVKARGATILPVDSEHSALFQAMLAGRREDVERAVLTASGGPFREATAAELEAVTVEQALAHPTWDMGPKVTVDSATMFNKALELLEACWLFDLPPGRVSVMVHPQSVIHSLVEYRDGNVLAQLSPPDMRTPIQYALTHPARPAGVGGVARRMDWTKAYTLELLPPDHDRFPALRLAAEAAEAGGCAGAVLNAANEVANEAFRDGRIGFTKIGEVVAASLAAHRAGELDVEAEPTTLDALLDADAVTRRHAGTLL